MRPGVVAATITGVAVALAVADTVLVAAAYQLFSARAVGIQGWPLVYIAAAGSAALGAVILGTHPRHPIGWLLSLVGVTASVSMATESYAVWVLRYDGPGGTDLGHLSGWVAALLGGPLALAGLTVVFLLVPDGRYLSPRWRWVALGAVGGYLVFALGLAVVGPGAVRRDGESVRAGPVAEALLSLGILVIVLAVIAGAVGLALRLRRSRGAVRQQVRMVAVGAATVGFALVVLVVGETVQDGEQTWWTSVPLYASYAFLVVCLGVAVLRYRLYDVEVIVSRAAALAIATGLVAIGYVAVVVTFARVLGEGTHAGFWPSLLAFVIVALAFQPVRRSVVRVADRLAYGERAAPYDALADLSRRIGRGPEAEQLLPTIAAAARDAVRAEQVEVRLGDADPGEEVVVPIADEAGVLGSIVLTMPPGRGVRPHERRLLTDIAEQSALALRNAHLQLELAARVAELDARTRELAASRRRVIDAADTERRRIEAEIGRRILPAMRRVRKQVAAQRPDGCVDLVTEALASLRDLTRGIYPATLARIGLGPALKAHAARAERVDSVRIAPEVAGTRFAAPVETAAYFCCVEVLRQSQGSVEVSLDGSGELVIGLDGVDLDALNRRAILDRVEACGGSLSPDSRQVRLPAATPAGAGPG